MNKARKNGMGRSGLEGWHDQIVDQRFYGEARVFLGGAVCWLRQRLGQKSGAWKKEGSLTEVWLTSIFSS